jgi:ABC-type uncharacterized transport system permease subunit
VAKAEVWQALEEQYTSLLPPGWHALLLLLLLLLLLPLVLHMAAHKTMLPWLQGR